MKLRELNQMITEDCELNYEALDTESLKTAYLQGKYMNLYSDEYLKLKAMYYKMDELKLAKEEYYSGKASPEVYKVKPLDLEIRKAKVELYVDNDDEVKKLQQEIDIQKTKVDLISDMKQVLSQRNWQIRNAVEFKKFTMM